MRRTFLSSVAIEQTSLKPCPFFLSMTSGNKTHSFVATSFLTSELTPGGYTERYIGPLPLGLSCPWAYPSSSFLSTQFTLILTYRCQDCIALDEFGKKPVSMGGFGRKYPLGDITPWYMCGFHHA